MQSQTTTLDPFRPNKLVTLLTDFGLSEPYVGIMKGVILSRCPAARCIDLTHDVPPYQTGLAGFWLARSWRYFPSGTLHLAVVDPGVGTERAMIVLEADGHAFVAPDNGLLEPVFHSATQARWCVFHIDDVRHVAPAGISNTFHGRDIFAPLVAEMIEGRISISVLGQPKPSPVARPLSMPNQGCIIGIDHFGNLISDIPAVSLERLIEPVVLFRGQSIPLQQSYGYAPAGSLLGLVNSWGTVEIALAQGNAGRTLQAKIGESLAVADSASSTG